MNPCIFCKIINDEAPATIVFRNKDITAFKALEPVAEGHTLVVPNAHSKNIFDISTESAASLFASAKKVAKQITEESKATGLNILHASGKDAQQTVDHFHLHLIPRYKDDGLDLWIKQGL